MNIQVCWEKPSPKIEPDELEEQNKCINSLERQEKAAESNIEWKKEKAPEALFFSKIPSENP